MADGSFTITIQDDLHQINPVGKGVTRILGTFPGIQTKIIALGLKAGLVIHQGLTIEVSNQHTYANPTLRAVMVDFYHR